MTYITSTVSREKLILKEFEPDSLVVSEPNSTKPTDDREFYMSAVELLALIYIEVFTQ